MRKWTTICHPHFRPTSTFHPQYQRIASYIDNYKEIQKNVLVKMFLTDSPEWMIQMRKIIIEIHGEKHFDDIWKSPYSECFFSCQTIAVTFFILQHSQYCMSETQVEVVIKQRDKLIIDYDQFLRKYSSLKFNSYVDKVDHLEFPNNTAIKLVNFEDL